MLGAGIRLLALKRQLRGSGLTLRLYRFRDLKILYSLFTPEVLSVAGGVGKAFPSLFSFSKWLRSAFQVVYVMEAGDNDQFRIIGFVGLYHLKIGQSFWLSLTIFNPEYRRQGYGRKALELLINSFQKNGAAETVYAEVLKTNQSSLLFLKKLGFKVRGQGEDKLLLVLTIGKR